MSRSRFSESAKRRIQLVWLPMIIAGSILQGLRVTHNIVLLLGLILFWIGLEVLVLQLFWWGLK